MAQAHRFDLTPFIVPPKKKKVKLSDYDPGYVGQIKGKKQSKETLEEDISDLAAAQELLWASKQKSLLIVFQALDAAGKDGTIKHVLSGINPQGCDVFSFKVPTEEERLHNFLWRPEKYIPQRGKIAIFNRSYYEEVLVVRVHPEILHYEWLPIALKNAPLDEIWKYRFKEINSWEKRLKANGITVIKFFLNLSKEEQRKRFLDRLDTPGKQWKCSPGDFKERVFWDQYQVVYEEMLQATSTKHAPWYVIPADNKWYTRAVVADVITSRIEEMDLSFPEVTQEHLVSLMEVRKKLKEEGMGVTV
ncbi:MAG: polyphosphate kinase 2 family protein [Bacteroidetes bacterium]|nr:polyphosphate kinase 2 family protein [Bacteroidota bacterium]MDA1122177.1 polyphosphate kinase 2 family protein [Bacteroidota bacterium]